MTQKPCHYMWMPLQVRSFYWDSTVTSFPSSDLPPCTWILVWFSNHSATKAPPCWVGYSTGWYSGTVLGSSRWLETSQYATWKVNSTARICGHKRSTISLLNHIITATVFHVEWKEHVYIILSQNSVKFLSILKENHRNKALCENRRIENEGLKR